LKAAIDDDGQMLPRSLSPTLPPPNQKKKRKKANRKQLKAATAADI